MYEILCCSALLLQEKYVPILVNVAIKMDADPKIIGALEDSLNKLLLPMLIAPIIEDKIITGKSIKAVIHENKTSHCLCSQLKQCAFSPVEAKYSSNLWFHPISFT